MDVSISNSPIINADATSNKDLTTSNSFIENKSEVSIQVPRLIRRNNIKIELGPEKTNKITLDDSSEKLLETKKKSDNENSDITDTIEEFLIIDECNDEFYKEVCNVDDSEVGKFISIQNKNHDENKESSKEIEKHHPKPQYTPIIFSSDEEATAKTSPCKVAESLSGDSSNIMEKINSQYESALQKILEQLKFRVQTNIVIVTDERDHLDLHLSGFNKQVEVYKVPGISFHSAFEEIKEHPRFGTGTVFVFSCGTHDLLKINYLLECEEFQCPEPIKTLNLPYSMKATLLIEKALKLNSDILEFTSNDVALFSGLIPVAINQFNEDAVKNQQCLLHPCVKSATIMNSKSYNLYNSAIGWYNKFCKLHSQTLGYPSWDLESSYFNSYKPVQRLCSNGYNFETNEEELRANRAKQLCKSLLFSFSSKSSVVASLTSKMKKNDDAELIEKSPSSTESITKDLQESVKKTSKRKLITAPKEELPSKLMKVMKPNLIEAIRSVEKLYADDLHKIMNLQRNRIQNNLVIVTDDRESFDFTLNNFDNRVTVLRLPGMNFSTAFSVLDEHDMFGKGTIFIFSCGIHDLLQSDTLLDCLEYNCSTPQIILKYIPRPTNHHYLIEKAMKLNMDILYATKNDIAMFCGLIPVRILKYNTFTIDLRPCRSIHPVTRSPIMKKAAYCNYRDAVTWYSNFAHYHAITLGYSPWDLEQTYFKNKNTTLLPNCYNMTGAEERRRAKKVKSLCGELLSFKSLSKRLEEGGTVSKSLILPSTKTESNPQLSAKELVIKKSKQDCSILARYILNTTPVEMVKSYFKAFGEIERIYCFKEKGKQRYKSVFVTFTDANMALKSLVKKEVTLENGSPMTIQKLTASLFKMLEGIISDKDTTNAKVAVVNEMEKARSHYQDKMQKIMELHKGRTQKNIVIVTDDRENFDIRLAECNDNVIALKEPKLQLAKTYEWLKKLSIFGKGTIFIIFCGTHDLLDAVPLEGCVKSHCPQSQHIFTFSSHINDEMYLTQQALNLHLDILKDTDNDTAVFCGILPISINQSNNFNLRNRACSFKHPASVESVMENSRCIYKKSLTWYNDFAKFHAETLKYGIWDFGINKHLHPNGYKCSSEDDKRRTEKVRNLVTKLLPSLSRTEPAGVLSMKTKKVDCSRKLVEAPGSLEAVQPETIFDKTVDILEPVKNRVVLVNNLNVKTSAEAVKSYFQHFGNVTGIHMKSQNRKNGKSALLIFSKSSSIVDLFKKKPHKIDGAELQVHVSLWPRDKWRADAATMFVKEIKRKRAKSEESSAEAKLGENPIEAKSGESSFAAKSGESSFATKSGESSLVAISLDLIMGMQKSRVQNNIVIVTDGREEFDNFPEEFNDKVEILTIPNLNFLSIFDSLKKHSKFGKGTIFIFSCGIHDILISNPLDDCVKFGCTHPQTVLTSSPDISDFGYLVKNLLDLHFKILKNTGNDIAMFCSLIPVGINQHFYYVRGRRSCSSEHAASGAPIVDPVSSINYKNIVNHYNCFTKLHSQTLGYDIFEFQKNLVLHVNGYNTISKFKGYRHKELKLFFSKLLCTLPHSQSNVTGKDVTVLSDSKDSKDTISKMETSSVNIAGESKKDSLSCAENVRLSYKKALQKIIPMHRNREQNNIVIVTDDRDYFDINLAGFGSGKIEVLKSPSLNYLSCFDFIKKHDKFGKGTIFVFFCGTHDLLITEDFKECIKNSCSSPLTMFKFSSTISDYHCLIKRALDLHEKILHCTSNDIALFCGLLPVLVYDYNKLRIKNRPTACVKHHPASPFFIKNTQLSDYEIAMKYYNEFTKCHAETLGFIPWNLEMKNLDDVAKSTVLVADGYNTSQAENIRRANHAKSFCLKLLPLLKLKADVLHKETLPSQRKVTKYERVTIIADRRYMPFLEHLKKPEVLVLADQELELHKLNAYLSSKKDYLTKDTLYLIVIGIHSAAVNVPFSVCKLSCKNHLDSLQSLDFSMKFFLLKLTVKLSTALDDIFHLLPSGSNFAILPPLPVSLISLAVSHKKLHENKSLFPDYLIANKTCLIRDWYPIWIDEILKLSLMSLSKCLVVQPSLPSKLDNRYKKLEVMKCSVNDKPSYYIWKEVASSIVNDALNGSAPNHSGESCSIVIDNVDSAMNATPEKTSLITNVDNAVNATHDKTSLINNVDNAVNSTHDKTSLINNVDNVVNTTLEKTSLITNVDNSVNAAHNKTSLINNVDNAAPEKTFLITDVAIKNEVVTIIKDSNTESKVLYDHLVFVGHENSFKLLPKIDFCSQSKLNFYDILDHESLLAKIDYLHKMAFKKVLFVIISDLAMIGLEEVNPECRFNKCQEPFSYSKVNHSEGSLLTKTKLAITFVKNIIASIEKFSSYQFNVIVAPFTPKSYILISNLPLTKFHKIMHDYLRCDTSISFLRGKTMNYWEENINFFEDEWRNFSHKLLNDKGAEYAHVLKIISDFKLISNQIHWKTLTSSFPDIICDVSSDWKSCLTSLSKNGWVDLHITPISMAENILSFVKEVPLKNTIIIDKQLEAPSLGTVALQVDKLPNTLQIKRSSVRGKPNLVQINTKNSNIVVNNPSNVKQILQTNSSNIKDTNPDNIRHTSGNQKVINLKENSANPIKINPVQKVSQTNLSDITATNPVNLPHTFGHQRVTNFEQNFGNPKKITPVQKVSQTNLPNIKNVNPVNISHTFSNLEVTYMKQNFANPINPVQKGSQANLLNANNANYMNVPHSFGYKKVINSEQNFANPIKISEVKSNDYPLPQLNQIHLPITSNFLSKNAPGYLMPAEIHLPPSAPIITSSELNDTNFIRTRDEVINFARNILNSEVYSKSHHAMFQNVYFVGKQALLNPLSDCNIESKLINHDFTSFDHKNLQDIVKKLGNFGKKSVCCLVFDITVITEVIVSSSCYKYSCPQPLYVSCLKTKNFYSSEAIAEIDDLVFTRLQSVTKFILELTRYIPVIILPLVPSRIFCDIEDLYNHGASNTYGDISHKLSHTLNDLGACVVYGPPALWKKATTSLNSSWATLMDVKNRNYDSYNLICTHRESNPNSFPIVKHVNDFVNKWPELQIWKALTEAIIEPLLFKDINDSVITLSFKSQFKILNVSSSIPYKFLYDLLTTIEEQNIDLTQEKDTSYTLKKVGHQSAKFVSQLNNHRVGDSILLVYAIDNPKWQSVSLNLMEKLFLSSVFEKVYKKWKFLIVENITKKINEVSCVASLKSMLCEKKESCKGVGVCPRYHSFHDKRRNPYLHNYTDTLCFKLKGFDGLCSEGVHCQLSHNMFETNFHPAQYQILPCPSGKSSVVCNRESLCHYAHRDTPEMLFTNEWQDLHIIGAHHSINFFAGAVRAIFKIRDLSRANFRVLLVSPSSEFLDIVISSTQKLMMTYAVHACILGKSAENIESCQILVGEPCDFVKIGGGILTNMIGAIIVDDIQGMFENDRQRNDILQFFNMLRTPYFNINLNKVFVSATYSSRATDFITEFIALKLKIVYMPEPGFSDKVPSNLCTNYKKTPSPEKDLYSQFKNAAEANTSYHNKPRPTSIERGKRLRSPTPVHDERQESHYLNVKSGQESSPKRRRSRSRSLTRNEMSISNVFQSRSFNEVQVQVQVNKFANKADERDSSPPFTSSSDNQRDSSLLQNSGNQMELRKRFGDKLFAEYSAARDMMLAAFEEECEVYRDVPELHPKFDNFCLAFNNEYDAENMSAQERNNFRKTVWESEFAKIKEEDWLLKHNTLITEFERKILCSRPEPHSNQEVQSYSANPEGESSSSFEESLYLLDAVSKNIPFLGLTVKAMVASCRDLGTTTKEAYDIFTNSEAVTLLNLVADKLTTMCVSTFDESRHLYEKAINCIPKFIDEAKKGPKQNRAMKKYPIDINKIAKISVGRGSVFALELIKSALTYEGILSPSTELINELFIKVCDAHFALSLRK